MGDKYFRKWNSHCSTEHEVKRMPALSAERSGEVTGEGSIAAASMPAACSVEDLLMYGTSAATQTLRQHIETAASLTCPILVRGSITDGARAVANAIHLRSSCRNRPLIRLECSTRFPSEAEAVLFGAERISPAVEIHRGTLVLENVEDLSLELQARLASTLQTNTRELGCAVRVIATSAVDLAQAACEGTFNRTLIRHLNSFFIRLPRLPERRDDIAGIAQIIIDSCSESDVVGVTPQAAAVLSNYPWQSIDQLRNCVEFAMRRAIGARVDTCDLPAELAHRFGFSDGTANNSATKAVDAGMLSLAELERWAIIEALRTTHGHKVKAAAILGIGKTTLYRKIKQFGL